MNQENEKSSGPSKSSESQRFIYIKGGHAVSELNKLANDDSPICNTGPDQFFLSVKKLTQNHNLRLITIGIDSNHAIVGRIEAIEYAARYNGNKIVKLGRFIRFAIQFISDTIRYKAKIIYCGLDGVLSVFVIIACQLSGAKLVFLSHNATNLSSVSKIDRLVNSLLVRQADTIVVHGPFLMAQAISLGAKPHKILSFDTWPLINATISPYNNQNNPIILFVGRLEKNKGVWDLIHAFQTITTHPNAELWFVGTGSLLPNIENNLLNQPKADRIKFWGGISHTEVSTFIQKCSFMVTPTQSIFPEGRCMSAMEAMANCKTVIAPNFGPFPYLIKDHVNGLLYQADSVQDLAKKISNLLDDNVLLKQLNATALADATEAYKTQISFYSTLERVCNQFTGHGYS
jgi:glycosyltransferase involved in cell wall biosynthesis